MESKDKDGTTITSETDVILGETVQIEVKSTDDAIAWNDFYLSDCTASNGLPSSDDDYKSKKLVTGGCMNDLGNLAAAIAASTSQVEPDTNDADAFVGSILQFNQFAFADENEGMFL